MAHTSTDGDIGWYKLGPVPELLEKGRHVLKLEGKQIALFETEDGLFAINNRCPHEGYPLVEGTMNDGCTLACNWHGWSFNLKTGKALQGRDPVRTYPIERRGQDIWVDLTPEPAVQRAEKAFHEFDEALSEHDYNRIARSLCRLEAAGVDYESTTVRTLRWSLTKFERGFGHAHAGLADWIALAGADPDLRLVGFLEALAHFSWDGLFSPSASLPAAAKSWKAKAFLADLEAMNSASVLARIKGGFADGLRYADMKSSILDFIFSHYGGFGHQAIYAAKLETLVVQLGDEIEETLVLQLALYLCVSAREDLIPEFRGFADYLKVEGGNQTPASPETLSGQSVRSAMALTAASLEHREALFDSLLAACALNMLHFDENRQHAVEQPIAQNVGWLDFTHALTFAESVHIHASANPAYWQSGLMQMACFVGRNSRFLTEQDWSRWHVEDKASFLAKEKAKLFNMDVGEYIYGVHRVKMVCAVEQLAKIASDATTDLVFAALNRYLHATLRQRHPARDAFQARETVAREG